MKESCYVRERAAMVAWRDYERETATSRLDLNMHWCGIVAATKILPRVKLRS
jgi:hypothetical protein